MYLNVSLTPPPSASEGSCSTPKTPEILNSIMSLTNPPLPQSYAHYQSQVGTGELLSPASSASSPCEEFSVTQFGHRVAGSTGAQNAPTNAKMSAGGSFILSRPRTISGGTPSSTGTPSPPVPELLSPVNTVEATKSALIKEGLKHQIRSKLKATGICTGTEPFPDVKVVKEENSPENELTAEDEERRRRRRERNKIAATKCRNKKKERTFILLSESEVVEDQNLKLKSEIKRLEKERAQLEKILGDPSHRASCRHSCGKRTCSLPLVVVTPPDAPDATTPPRATGLSPSSPPSTQSPSSIAKDSTVQSGHTGVPYCQASVSPSTESYVYESPSYPCDAPPLISYDPSLSPSATLSDAFTSLSPPKLQPHSVALTPCLTSSPCSSLQPLTSMRVASTSQTSVASKAPPVNETSLTYVKGGSENSSNTLVHKHSLAPSKRYMPYQVIRHSNEGSVVYPSSKSASDGEERLKESDLECYLPVTTEEEEIQGSLYMYPHQSPLSDRHSQVNDRNDNIYPLTKTRSQSRYTPYPRLERVAPPILTEVGSEYADSYYQQGTCSQNAPSQLYSESVQNQFYPQCNF